MVSERRTKGSSLRVKGNELPFLNNRLVSKACSIGPLFILLLVRLGGEGWKAIDHLINLSLVTVDLHSNGVLQERPSKDEVKDTGKLDVSVFSWVPHLPVGVAIFTPGRKDLFVLTCMY